MNRQICIVGGSGFVGRAISKQALAAGYDVRVACRHPERAQDMMVDGVDLVKVDVINGSGLRDAVAGCGAVINLVGLLFERGKYSFDAAHVQGSRHLLAACEEVSVAHFIQMSALGVNENPKSIYARTKTIAEQQVKQSRMHWTIFKPSLIFGAGDSFFLKLKSVLAVAPAMPVFSPTTCFQPIWVEDVARAFVLALGNRKCYGQSYALAGPHVYSMQALMESLMRVTGYQRLLIPVPSFAAKAFAMATAWLPTPLITLDQLQMMETDNIVGQGDSYPQCFGEASSVEAILPTYIKADAAGRLQNKLDVYRKHAR
ncbi:MAG: complex I NDUFA9 subunit family protein [Zetaproteobacteria bacterium]|nr:complex I NDUFA9 subunit family protein [Zetaproteobacteria bacterium]